MCYLSQLIVSRRLILGPITKQSYLCNARSWTHKKAGMCKHVCFTVKPLLLLPLSSSNVAASERSLSLFCPLSASPEALTLPQKAPAGALTGRLACLNHTTQSLSVRLWLVHLSYAEVCSLFKVRLQVFFLKTTQRCKVIIHSSYCLRTEPQVVRADQRPVCQYFCQSWCCRWMMCTDGHETVFRSEKNFVATVCFFFCDKKWRANPWKNKCGSS